MPLILQIFIYYCIPGVLYAIGERITNRKWHNQQSIDIQALIFSIATVGWIYWAYEDYKLAWQHKDDAIRQN